MCDACIQLCLLKTPDEKRRDYRLTSLFRSISSTRVEIPRNCPIPSTHSSTSPINSRSCPFSFAKNFRLSSLSLRESSNKPTSDDVDADADADAEA